MSFLTRHSISGFIVGILFTVALEGAGLFLFMNSIDQGDSVEQVGLETPPVPSGINLCDMKFEFTDMLGHTKQSQELNGQVVVLNLWATWCPPCRAEMPSLDALWKKYQGRVGVYCISEEALEDVRSNALLKTLGMPVYVFASDAPEQIDTKGLPTTYIFGKDGRLLFTHTGMADWNSAEVCAFLDSLL